MAMLQIPTVSTNHFSFKNGQFSAFASDLNGLGKPSRVYDDACDVGFWLQSAVTGKKILMVEAGAEYDAEGDLECVLYSAYCLRENPKHTLNLKMKIWND